MKRRKGERVGVAAQKAAFRARGAGRGTAAARAPQWSLRSDLVLALILIGIVLLHRDVLKVTFFADDYLFLEQVRGRSLLAAVTSPDAIGNFFRPVGRQLYYWLLGHLSGESPVAFHAANLVLFVALVSLLFIVARRLAGPLAAAVAAGFIALHYSADVPLRWVAGSQDLLAVTFSLAAIALYVAGRRWWAVAPLLLGLLSKETVVFTPLIAAAAGRRPGESWRGAAVRAWPLGLTVAVWALLWAVTAPQRRGLGASLGLEPLGPLAVVVHLAHVSLGLEWRSLAETMSRVAPPWIPLIPVAVAVVAARPAVPGARAAGAPIVVGLLWALAASVPLVAVASVWSAYYYIYALCGVALLLGALVARGPRWAALALVVVLAAGSQAGRANPEFSTARGAWNWQSHTNRRYIDRATERIAHYLAEMKRLHPTVPPRSTFFFAGVPAFLAWQAADGPLVRWAYRDTSLRSYYQANFTLARGMRGPMFFLYVDRDTLKEEQVNPSSLRGIALRNILSDREEAARDMLQWLIQSGTSAPDVLYFLTWLEWARGDTVAARACLTRAGIPLARGQARVDHAARLRAAGDTATAINVLATDVTRYPFDPRGHAALSDLLLQNNPADAHGRVEALAARALTPEDPDAWLRWGLIQTRDGRHTQAMRSLERSLALGLGDSQRATQVRSIVRDLARMVPGGELTQAEMRRGVGRPQGQP